MTTAQMPVTVYLTNEAGVPLSGEIELIAEFFETDTDWYELDTLQTDSETPINITPSWREESSRDEAILWDKVQRALNYDTETQSRAHYAIQQEAA